ncbi:MAG: hypothetical protein LDL39_03905 [Magnetospirillum sp.]|nr:hypothetical protein [Magnetospirillum sp.]
MSAVLQGVILLLVGSAVVYGLLMCVGSGKAAGGHGHGHDSHGGHGHH